MRRMILIRRSRRATTGTREHQARRVAIAAYYGSRRPRRPAITMVPAVGSTPEKQTQRSVVVPAPVKTITWQEAHKIGAAYARVLDGQDKYPAPPKKKLAMRQRKRLKKIRRDPRGTWWMEKLADLVEKRRAAESAAKEAP